ncbi:hypothetical protein KB206_11350 [Microvirga sp. STS02]|uniref:hypothetical protein n=1 Tax=Hymenobacter negativus TaxID=2795026 RepID=UPI0018DE5319|nr:MULTISPECIES: hypothetical protein [Bacteria]MBH8569482.1 hypothetical protein [Hymenobacter negativus]MBR7209218.1 hypothetical protein [Microvirga sp. STS02]
MLLRNTLSSIIKAFQIFQKAMLYMGIVFLFGIGLFLAKNYCEIPDFLFAIKEQMVKNPDFISEIGESNGYTIWFDKDLASKKSTVPFSVSINGKNDSTFVQITGVYNLRDDGRIEFTKKDTIFSNK